MSSPSFETSYNYTPGRKASRHSPRPPLPSRPSALPDGHQSFSLVGIDALMPRPEAVGLPPVEQPMSAAFDANSSRRHEVNPALALNLLTDIQVLVSAWQQQLRQVVRAIHQIEAQGPMVDGWLESITEESTPQTVSAAVLRHGDADALMQYVESLEQSSASDLPAMIDDAKEITTSGVTQYRLCRLGKDGTVRSHPCPPEQMAVVSLAIARYQKFRQLSQQRQALETKLQGVVNQLTGVRTELQESKDAFGV